MHNLHKKVTSINKGRNQEMAAVHLMGTASEKEIAAHSTRIPSL
jgi:hypothetical protein